MVGRSRMKRRIPGAIGTLSHTTSWPGVSTSMTRPALLQCCASPIVRVALSGAGQRHVSAAHVSGAAGRCPVSQPELSGFVTLSSRFLRRFAFSYGCGSGIISLDREGLPWRILNLLMKKRWFLFFTVGIVLGSLFWMFSGLRDGGRQSKTKTREVGAHATGGMNGAQAPTAPPAVPPSTVSQSVAPVRAAVIPGDAPPAVKAFRDWAGTYLAATPADRSAMEQQGVALARRAHAGDRGDDTARSGAGDCECGADGRSGRICRLRSWRCWRSACA